MLELDVSDETIIEVSLDPHNQEGKDNSRHQYGGGGGDDGGQRRKEVARFRVQLRDGTQFSRVGKRQGMVQSVHMPDYVAVGRRQVEGVGAQVEENDAPPDFQRRQLQFVDQNARGWRVNRNDLDLARRGLANDDFIREEK